jgi:GTP-binding protein
MADTPGGTDADAIEAGRRLFAQSCRFVAAAATLERIPPATFPEVAFSGRSNVGKSTLVNALTGRSVLARVSSTPGRTRQLNFFELGERLILTDLPGYGYAKASKSDVAAWNRLVEGYLAGRQPLTRVLILIDGRHGIKPPDEEMMARLDTAAVSYQAVLTKCDKMPAGDLSRQVAAVTRALARRPAAHPVALATSARSGVGIPELRAALAALAGERV